MPCDISRRRTNNTRNINLNHYSQLHSEGRQLISGWFQRALRELDCSPEASFEPFIFTWFAFNGWAACVTDEDIDRQIINKLAASSTINNDFVQAVQSNLILRKSAIRFSDLLPIFDVREIRRSGIRTNARNNRQERVNFYFDQGFRSFSPNCWQQHLNSGEPLPIDWGHLLNGLYQVRCNLFHGLKSAHSEMDQTIVHSAYLLLAHFLHETRYLET